ncbi:hypothetical protein [Pontibacter virosus]|uniref:hypothetical protein n=1 Tax=Pontibacter virosus TaxID=1765052 RepID=UPI001057D605|nr:hypothetical protein [Pontibacter virosus]
MKKTGLILLGGLLFISLSRGNSRATLQTSCAAVHHDQEVTCHLTKPAASLASANTPAAQTTVD